ncbi:MAG: RNA 2',3'-cyclic phosphodiesterase [Chloroflexia bacterium]|nr:RNA 2',3'-cyclic phosphodiesterase [Chloroflexia bacterium]
METVDTSWRLFIAVPLPPAVITFVDGIIGELSQEGWPVRWVAPEGAHLTLHFLGSTEPERAQLLRLALGPVVAGHPPFQLRTADFGAFPSIRRPRVIWLGLHGPAHRLASLHAALGETLAAYEFEVAAEEQFHPHITLGRVRNVRDQSTRDLPAAIRQRLDELTKSGQVSHRNPIPLPVDEVRLMRSHLARDGARYETIERYPLVPSAQP